MIIKTGISKLGLSVIDAAIERAYGFMTARYGYQFNDVDLAFVAASTRGRWKPGIVKIPVTHEFNTYNMATIGVTANRLKVGYELGTALVIVHELTHHVQFKQRRKLSEVETTQNELDFMTQADPAWLKFLKPVKGQVKQVGWKYVDGVKIPWLRHVVEIV